MELNEELRKKAEVLKQDIQFAIIMASASEAPYVAIRGEKAKEIYILMDEISKGREAET